MDIKQLRYFLAIAEYESFARAATHLGVTQSALTQSIARLETGLKSRLFERGRRGASITDAGSILLPRARLIVAEAVLAAGEVKGLRGSARPKITIGIGKSVVGSFVPEAICRLVDKAPNVAVSVVEGFSPDLYAQLQRGELDFVVSAPLPHLVAQPDLRQEALSQQLEVASIGRSHPLFDKKDVALSDLTNMLWMTPPAGNGRMRYLQRVFQDAGLEPPTRFLRNDSNMVGMQLLAEGRVVGHAILETVGTAIDDAGCRILRIPELTFDRTVFLSFRKRSRLQASAFLLAEQIRSASAAEAQRPLVSKQGRETQQWWERVPKTSRVSAHVHSSD